MRLKLTGSLALILALGACGGGGGEENGSTSTPPSTSTSTSIRLLELGQQISANHFSLADGDFTPAAVALKNNLLYVANDRANAAILRYDLNTRQALPPLSSFQSNGISERFQRLNDISLFQDKLYTASLSSNRVDIFDIAQGEPRFITSLGTGSWSGPAERVLVHPMAVAANANYVFAADTQQRISVWKQSDAIAANHKNALKHAYLSLPGCSTIYCDVKLATVGERLFASFGNGKTLVYDISQLAASPTPVQPVMQQINVGNALAQGDDGQLYVSRTAGGIDRFAPTSLPASGEQILPATAIDQYRQINLPDQAAGQALQKAKAISFNQQKIAAIQNQNILILPQKQIDEIQHTDSSTPQTTLYAAIPAAQKERVLQDSDSWETLTDPEQRSFNMHRILSGKLKPLQLELSSYSALPVKDLEIQASLKGSGQWFVLGKLDELPAFSKLKFDAPIRDEQRFARVDGKGSVQFNGLNALSQRPADLFEIKIDSRTDAHVQKIGQFKMKWKIFFGKYDEAGKWGRINPAYAREWVIMMTNFAYVINSKEFEHLWFNHKKVMGHDFFGNAGQVNAPGGFFSSDDYRKYYEAIMNRGGIRLGVTTMGGGLGGGDVLGVDTWNFYQQYFTNNGIVGHEFGHHFGSHDSAWANSGYGLQKSMAQLHQYFIRKQQLPYTDPNTNSFHLSPRELLYSPVNEAMRKPRPSTDINDLERYFMANPI